MKSRPLLLAIISELVLWGALISLIFAIVHFATPFVTRQGGNGEHTVTLYFKDANQLGVGSPVNFMGTDIGYVSRLRPKGHRVEVQFKTYQDTTPIPKGAHFTVEFNSLAGAKTLEVLPPGYQEITDVEDYIIEEPIRLKDVLYTQNVLANALESSSKNFAQSLGRYHNPQSLIQDIQNINRRIVSADHTLIYVMASMRDQSSRLHAAAEFASGSINSFTHTLLELEAMTSPESFRSGTLATMRYLRAALTETYMSLEEAQNRQYVRRFDNRLAQAQRKILGWKGTVEQRLPPFFSGWNQFNIFLSRANRFFGRLDTRLATVDSKTILKSVREKTRRLSEATRRFTGNRKKPKP